jgi:apolipoprotein N-acyltransferase
MKQMSFISGILYGLSYPLALNIPTGILAWFALVPMLLSLREATTFKQFCFKTLPVLFIGTYIFGAFVFAFGIVAGLVTCFSQCILTFLPLIVHYFIQKRIGWRRSMLLLPLVWTIGDWVQHLMPHSFQISSIAYTQTTVLWFAQLHFGLWQ